MLAGVSRKGSQLFHFVFSQNCSFPVSLCNTPAAQTCTSSSVSVHPFLLLPFLNNEDELNWTVWFFNIITIHPSLPPTFRKHNATIIIIINFYLFKVQAKLCSAHYLEAIVKSHGKAEARPSLGIQSCIWLLPGFSP